MSNVRPLRGLNALDNFAAKARGLNNAREDLGVYSPCVALSATFPLQSYFDSTAYQLAILRQFPNELIINTSLTVRQSSNIDGYAVALHPASEMPIAVNFQSSKDNAGGASATVILKPGEIIRPSDGPFTGITWGVPFGWLGGGAVTLIVFNTAQAIVNWTTENKELLFHRIRLPILAPASVPTVANGRIDWPIRFPWTNAYSTSTNQPQFGKPTLGITPTKVQIIVRLAASTSVTAASMRFLLANFDNYTLTSTNTNSGEVAFFDAVVPTYSNPAGMAQQTGAFPVLEYTSGPLLGGGDSAVVTLMDMDDSGATNLAGVEVDICRYGRL